MRKRTGFELVVVVASQIPQIRHMAASRRDKETLPPVELSEVDFPRAIPFLMFLHEIDAKLRVGL